MPSLHNANLTLSSVFKYKPKSRDDPELLQWIHSLQLPGTLVEIPHFSYLKRAVRIQIDMTSAGVSKMALGKLF